MKLACDTLLARLEIHRLCVQYIYIAQRLACDAKGKKRKRIARINGSSKGRKETELSRRTTYAQNIIRAYFRPQWVEVTQSLLHWLLRAVSDTRTQTSERALLSVLSSPASSWTLQGFAENYVAPSGLASKALWIFCTSCVTTGSFRYTTPGGHIVVQRCV